MQFDEIREIEMNDIQVTHDTNPNNARSESNVAINPLNPMQMVAGSKKFNNIQTYDFTLATAYSSDGGSTWNDSAPLPMPGFTLLTDPALAWDDAGGVYLVGLSGNNPPTFDTIGIEIYKSINGGQTWSNPTRIHTSVGDDKQWAAGDGNPGSPFHGRVYAVWDDGSAMRFARTLDYGNSWVGAGGGNTPAGTVLVNDSFAPEINVAANGDIYIVWISGTEIKMIVSTDGGDSFHAVASPATGVTPISASSLPSINGWKVFPGANFRLVTVPSAAVWGSATATTKVVVAWADVREGVSRIYCACSTNGGASWVTGASGLPMLTGAQPANFHHFHPQIVFCPDGVVGCAFYEFGPKPSTLLIDVVMVLSHDHGGSFGNKITVTDQPWNPAVDAPWSHGNSNVTFIGDYFGLDASSLGFSPVWTDTRTGIQELWTDRVPCELTAHIPRYDQVAQILAGIIQDGGGIEIVGGRIIRVPPWDPEVDILLGIACHRIATLISSPEGAALQAASMQMVAKVAQQELRRLGMGAVGRAKAGK